MGNSRLPVIEMHIYACVRLLLHVFALSKLPANMNFKALSLWAQEEVDFLKFCSERVSNVNKSPASTAPSVSEILATRWHKRIHRRYGKYNNSLHRLYAMYHYLVMGITKGYGASSSFSSVSPPADFDPERTAILAVLTYYMCEAFNRNILLGLTRDVPSVIVSLEAELALKRQPKVLETPPAWATRVPHLDTKLVLPFTNGSNPERSRCCDLLLELGIRAERPAIHFI